MSAPTKIIPIPQWQDNYAYLIIAGGHGDAIAVDPADPDPIIAKANEEGVFINAIFNTHHHPDHVDGNLALSEETGAVIHGSSVEADKIPGLQVEMVPGETTLVVGLEVEVMLMPGHTDGHVGYRIGKDFFTGDTLFVGGCGRLFEGTPAQMYQSLHEVIGKLPDDTRIWCGHEYTVKNLEFALSLEPGNEALQKRYEQAKAERSRGELTVPSTVGDEKAFNPFLRSSSPELIASVKKQRPDVDENDPVAVFAATRELKDNF